MNIKLMTASAALLALAACGGEREADTIAVDNMAMNNIAAEPMADANAISDPIPANGQQYAAMAAASDMYEIESARLAMEKSQNAEIRELAQMILTDHQKSTADLEAAAAQAQPAIMVSPGLTAEQETMMQALRAANGAQFDQTYLTQQIMAHQKALAMVQAYAANGEVPSLKQHAATVAGPIQQHLERAQQLQSSL